MSQQTQSSKFFDFIDDIDRYLYGRKMKNFLIGSILVLIVAPVLDWLLEVPFDRLTWLATFVFFLYVLVIVLAWISAWRDEDGKWTLKRAQSRLITYYQTFRDAALTTKTTTPDELLYKAGGILFFGAIGWKSLQNLSVFVRKPIQALTGHKMIRFIHFEILTKHWFWLPLILGIGIMGYLYYTNPNILKRIKKDLLQLFGRRPTYGAAQGMAIKTIRTDLVVNTKHEQQMQSITVGNNSTLFTDFVNAMKCWDPGSCTYEYEYQDKLYLHLKNSLANAVIETEYPIGDKAHGNKRRADIVIDHTILIEMKRKQKSTGEADRAKGQIRIYSEIWNNRGPVILLLCGHEYEHAKTTFTPALQDFVKLEKPVLAIVHES